MKYEAIMISDCRGITEIDSIRDFEFSSGREVMERVIEEEMKDKLWIDYVNDMLGKEDEGWENDKEVWSKIFFTEGKLDNKEFLITMHDELRECLILREDSEHYGKFKRDADFRDEENIDLFYSIWEVVF